jgi:ankyrin repeat protein
MATKRRVSAKRFLAAIESGDIELVERLLAKGADLRGCWYESPSSCAVRNGHTAIIALLIRHGLDPRENDDLLFSGAVYWRQPHIMKLLAITVFAPDLWRGKALKAIQEEADRIYTKIEKGIDTYLPEAKEEASRLARVELFDAAMTCWEHVRPDPPKINISIIPAKGKPV